MRNSYDCDFPLPPPVSRRLFVTGGPMLPLAGAAPGSPNTLFGRSEAGILGDAGANERDETTFPPYPGALVGLWCAAAEVKRGDGSQPQQPWVLEIPLGWLETTVTAAYETGGKAEKFAIASVEVLLDGRPAGRLSQFRYRSSDGRDIAPKE